MKVHIKIQRYNPELDQAPHWTEHDVEVEPTDRVLDALHQVKWYQDGTLTLRRSCAHGICGSDAIQPLLGIPVIKDLVVDMEGFFAKYKSIKPYLINDEPEPERERLQSVEQRERFDDTTKCILCAACTTSCPSFWANSEYVGPAAIVQEHRFLFDSRDRGAQERLAIMSEEMGVWRCRTAFNCVEACPRGIDVTRAIAEVKKAIIAGKAD
jgi:succinate dehydrogenase / fumarate reductase iron-sulfur subunit